MDSGPEVETHHHHHTGHRWLDIILALSAMVVSVVSLFVAVHHGKTMEKMVEADTWPYVEFARSMVTPDNKPAAVLLVANDGVGPARVETVEVRYKGKPVTDTLSFLKDASGDDSLAANAITSTITDRVIRAGSKVEFLIIVPPEKENPAFTRYRQALKDVSTTICYCSALDECWVRDSDQDKPEHVAQCPKSAAPYEH